MGKNMHSIDGNTAATHASYALTEVAAIYPITPSSPMGELADEWSANGKQNIFGEQIDVIELQSEGGAAGAVHGSLSAGALTTTYTASQGLLLMIPNLYKIAGELLPGVFHVSARSLAGHALSIFGDHGDVMACRQTGVCMLAGNSVQEAQDLGMIAHLSAIKASLPFINFFDGFRTSHEIQKVEMLDYEDIRPIIDFDAIKAFKDRAMRPEKPILKGTAQNPDIFFQAKEAANPYYDAVPAIVQEQMDKYGKVSGRTYKLFDYVGAPDAERVIIAMGSGCDAIEEAIDFMTAKGDKVGLIKVRLYRPFSAEHFLGAIPATANKVAVLDRTKEPGSDGEPLYKDVLTALYENGKALTVVGGRYGLSSKEFTPGMVVSVFDNLSQDKPKNHFTVGIVDDVTKTSLNYTELNTTPEGTKQCKFWGLGSDGTVGANKSAIKIIGDNTDLYAQGYFAYDSKKSGGITMSHLRFGKSKIKAPYLITHADYIACHQQSYVYQYALLDGMKKGGTFVLNTAWSPSEVEENLPSAIKKAIAESEAKFYIIDAVKIAEEVGLGNRINMIMQTAFFKLAEVIPFDEAVALLKKAIDKAYGKKGEKIVKMNCDAVDKSTDALVEVQYDAAAWKGSDAAKKDVKRVHEAYRNDDEKKFVEEIMDPINAQKGWDLPVSAFSSDKYGWLPAADGSFPTASTRYEKRGVAVKLPLWNPEKCIACNQCSYVCPHATIRPVLLTAEEKAKAPESFVTITPKNPKMKDFAYRIQVYPMDCVGCGNCADICPGKALTMEAADPIRDAEVANNDFSVTIPEKTDIMPKTSVIGSQLQKPLFEFSGACAGCGETPYVKLVTQLFGDRMIVANATGCSSIYGGSAPVCPYTTSKDGNGPAWANSLFEDNAEYGFGMALAVMHKRNRIAALMKKAVEEGVDDGVKALFTEWLENMKNADKTKELAPQLKDAVGKGSSDTMKELQELSDYFVKKSVWILGGDGWAYDIGYGGLDHVMASGVDVNVLVLDTEVYSNTGGQASKSSQFGQVAKFAASGKKLKKKEMGQMMMSYGYVYVGSVSMGASQNQTLKTFVEAEQYDGPSIVMAYAPCINHGLNMSHSQKEAKLAVETGMFSLYRFNPDLAKEGKNPFILDSKEPSKDVQELIDNEVRFRSLNKAFPEEAARLQAMLREDIKARYAKLKKMAE